MRIGILILAGLVALAFGVIQVVAAFIGLANSLGDIWAVVLLAPVLTLPLLPVALRLAPITIGAFACALYVWQWHWAQAFAFTLPGFLLMVPGVADFSYASVKQWVGKTV